MAVTVQLNRPCFQIPVGETIEEILQYVLYHRRQVPVVVPALLSGSECTGDPHIDYVRLEQSHSSKLSRFCIGFKAARNSFHQIFRSKPIIDFRRAAIVIGNSPSTPMDLYLIEFQVATTGSDSEYGTVSLTNCERRKIVRQLVEQGLCYRRGDSDFKEINRATKTFLFVEARRGVEAQALQPRPDLDFLRYCVSEHGAVKRPKSAVHWTVLKITGDCGPVEEESSVLRGLGAASETPISVQSEESGDEEKDVIWYQFQEPIHGFDE